MADIQIDADLSYASVQLVGKTYQVPPVKTFALMGFSNLANISDLSPEEVTEAFSNLIGTLFAKKDAPKIMARLSDPNDALDLPHIIELMNSLVARASEGAEKRPTM